MSNEKTGSGAKNKWETLAEEAEAEAAGEHEAVTTEASATQDDSGEAVGQPDVHQLQDRITALERQLKDAADGKLRLSAELQNVRDRAARDAAKARKFATEQLLNDLLPVLDSLTRGLENGSDSSAHQALLDGMQLTLEMFSKTLTSHGVTLIAPAVGDTFDPEIHEAMSMQKAPDTPANTILQLLQQGYSLNGRVIRAAMVIVAG